MKIVTISGCHVQGAAPPVQELVVHAGLHYDYNIRRVFFEELAIPEPNYHLVVGSGSHGHMTGQMLAKAEDVFVEDRPDWVLVPPTRGKICRSSTSYCFRVRKLDS
jgi:UDP-N-acetylglucosamine 2-epimerase